MHAKTLPPARPARLKAIDRSSEFDWIGRHRQEYSGEWVVLDGDRLIGHGSDPLPLVESARSQGIQRPLVVRMEEEPNASTGGWL